MRHHAAFPPYLQRSDGFGLPERAIVARPRPEPGSRAERTHLRLSSCLVQAICGAQPFPWGMVEMFEGFSQLRLTKAESSNSPTLSLSPRETGPGALHSIGKSSLAMEVIEEAWGWLHQLRGDVSQAMLVLCLWFEVRRASLF